MRRFPTTLVILVVMVVGLIAGWRLFWPSETQRYQAVKTVRQQRSEIHLSQAVVHAKGPIAREELRLDNVEGKSTASYTVADRKGYVAHFSQPIQGYDVTFAFDLLVRDGIWQLQRPTQFHGNTNEIYTVAISQAAGSREGRHSFTFADPHYLATTAGRQYEIHLDKTKPVPSEADLLRLKSTSLADPRYQKIVDDFATFGPPRFKQTVAAARAKLLSS
jgi:hypothetical protein